MARFAPTTIAAVGIVLISGCAGVRFDDEGLNTQQLPNDYKERTIIKNSVDYRLNPSSEIGLIVSPQTNGDYVTVGRPVLASGSAPKEEAFKDGQVYDDKIDAGAAAQGNYLTFAANLSAKETAEVEIVDATHAYVLSSEIPDDQLFTIAASTSAAPRYWIQDLYISTISVTKYTQEAADASGSGPAFGAKGNVYATHTKASHDFQVAARLINIDQYAQVHNKPHNGPIPTDVALVTEPPSRGVGISALPVTYAVLPPVTLNRHP